MAEEYGQKAAGAVAAMAGRQRKVSAGGKKQRSERCQGRGMGKLKEGKQWRVEERREGACRSPRKEAAGCRSRRGEVAQGVGNLLRCWTSMFCPIPLLYPSLAEATKIIQNDLLHTYTFFYFIGVM